MIKLSTRKYCALVELDSKENGVLQGNVSAINPRIRESKVYCNPENRGYFDQHDPLTRDSPRS